MLHAIYGLAYIFALTENRYRDFHFLAGGKTLAGLQKARAGYDRQQAVLKEVHDHFGSSRVSLACPTELNYGWPEMKKSHGFKVYFEKGKQPEGWFIPERWGDRQRYWETHVYLPKQGSEAQQFLAQAADKLRGIQAAYGQGASRKDYSSGWYSWEGDVLPKGKGMVYSTRVTDDVFTVFVRDSKDKKEPDYQPENSVMISKEDAKMLETNPEKASARARYLLKGQSLRSAYERLSYRLGL